MYAKSPNDLGVIGAGRGRMAGIEQSPTESSVASQKAAISSAFSTSIIKWWW